MNELTKASVESAINRASNSVLSVVRVFEDHGRDLTDEHVSKVFAHLQAVLGSMMQRANAARTIQKAEIGAFSLDAAPVKIDRPSIPQTPTNVDDIAERALALLAAQSQEQAAPAAPRAPEKPKWVRPEGRLAGTKEPIYATPATKMNGAEAAELTAVPDKTGFIKEAGFLDK